MKKHIIHSFNNITPKETWFILEFLKKEYKLGYMLGAWSIEVPYGIKKLINELNNHFKHFTEWEVYLDTNGCQRTVGIGLYNIMQDYHGLTEEEEVDHYKWEWTQKKEELIDELLRR